MFKKLLALAAVALCVSSVNAKEVIDMTVDWTKNTWNGYVMGYIPTTSAEEGLIFEWPHFTYKEVDDDGANPDGYEIVKINGTDNYVVPTEDGGPMESWGIQAHLLTGNCETVIGTNYVVTIVAKSNKADGVTLALPMSWNWSGGTCNGSVLVKDEWDEYVCEYADECGGASCWLVGQMYDKEGRIAIKSVTISHFEEDGEGPVFVEEWENWLVNGDAEGEYGEVPCAYAKEYAGRGADGSETASPKPAEIVTIDGNKVFVVHAKAVDPNEYPNIFLNDDGTVKGDPQWQNQFWIQSPKAWKEGDSFRISFKYKASSEASADTQAHLENPGDYKHWELLGSPNFTTEWQEWSKEVTVNKDQAGMWSCAFNLKDYEADRDYYFDDLKWETLKLEEGFFCAENPKNVNSSVEMVWDDDENAFVVEVGVSEPVQEVKISTRRGRASDFNANCIVNSAPFDINECITEDGSWVAYTTKAAGKVTLPEPGHYKIMIDDAAGQIGAYSLDPSGIASVAADNAPAVYYNLQGVKVMNPAAGQVYIVKQGSKVSKTIIR